MELGAAKPPAPVKEAPGEHRDQEWQPGPGLRGAGSREHTRGRGAQGGELLSFVAELWEGVSRLRSIRESEEIVYWNCSLPSLGQTCQADRTRDTEDSLSSLCPTEHGDLRDRGEQQQVPARCSRPISSRTISPSQVAMRLWKWNPAMVRMVVHLGWRCCQG